MIDKLIHFNEDNVFTGKLDENDPEILKLAEQVEKDVKAIRALKEVDWEWAERCYINI